MERTRPLYQHIAVAITARINCDKATPRNVEWFERWTEKIETLQREYLPSGSGVDSGSTIDLDRSTADKIVIHTSYHHMNDVGYYDGWTEHTVTIRPDWDGVRLVIGGRDRNDIKDYLYEIFDIALNQPITETEDGYSLAA